jgi:hypothetical protein
VIVSVKVHVVVQFYEWFKLYVSSDDISIHLDRI